MDKFFANDEVGLKQTVGKDDKPGTHTNELVREGAVVEFAEAK